MAGRLTGRGRGRSRNNGMTRGSSGGGQEDHLTEVVAEDLMDLIP